MIDDCDSGRKVGWPLQFDAWLENSCPLGTKLPDQALDCTSALSIQSWSWFIQEEQHWLMDNGHSDGQAAAHAFGEVLDFDISFLPKSKSILIILLPVLTRSAFGMR